MAFKGAWHRGDGGGGGGNTGASGDRRYTSSADSFSSFVLPPQGVPGNQMALPPMNYQTNPNAMYSVMNSGPSLMPSTNYSSAAKSLPYTGTISNIFRDLGVIDNEISFKLNTVSGPLPRVGDRVVCQMKPAEGFATQTPYKYYGFDVRAVQATTDTRRPPRPTGGQQQMPRTSDPYVNRNQNRNQSSSVKRPPLPSANNNNNNNNKLDSNNNYHQYGNNNNRDRRGSMNNGSNNDRHRASPARRSGSRTNKTITPKRTARAPVPKYTCTLPKASLDCSELNVTQIRSRYSRLHIPSDFYHASYTWHQSIPLHHPLKLITPCSFHIFNKNVPQLSNENVAIADPTDADYTWNVRVMLMSSPDIQTLISRSCLVTNESNKTSTINPDDLEHPSKLIKFLVGLRHQNEYFPLGGSWSQSLDGANPESDPQVLVRTAIRCVKSQTGIDLSKCIQWCRYLEVRYHRPEEIHKGRLIESRVENIVVFLPDIAAACMPSSLEWEETIEMCKQKCDEEIAEELNEANIPDDTDSEAPSASHHSAIDIDNLRVAELKKELKARNQPVTGLKVDLKKRLTKILQQEKTDEEKAEAPADGTEEQPPSSTVPAETGSNSTKAELKEHSQADIEKIRKEIEGKYQLPANRSILVHPTTAKGDKFDCRVVSLHYLLNYANKDTIKEKCFELYLFSEAFQEMLMRDYSYHIYRSLYSCLEVTDTSVEPSTAAAATDNEQQESNTDDKEEQPEAMITSGDDAVLPELDLTTDENEKKRKRTASEDDLSSERKKSAQEEPSNDNVKSSSTAVVQTRPRTVDPELLLAFTFYDRNRCGYVIEKDLEEILLLSGLSLTKNEAKMLVSRIAHHEKVQYHQLTDKALPVDDSNETNHLTINESDIDPLAPKGNLLFLPQHVSVYGLRSSISNEGNQAITSVDNQRAMKQLEISNKIQTGLELKIDTLKKDNNKLTDELHASQKSNRSYTDQLSETKKRLRETQHDLKELEEKYKRYSDALYRVRSESRTTLDHLTQVLGIKEKQPSQTRKSEDETKKSNLPKPSNDKSAEKVLEDTPAVKSEENISSEVNDTEQ